MTGVVIMKIDTKIFADCRVKVRRMPVAILLFEVIWWLHNIRSVCRI